MVAAKMAGWKRVNCDGIAVILDATRWAAATADCPEESRRKQVPRRFSPSARSGFQSVGIRLVVLLFYPALFSRRRAFEFEAKLAFLSPRALLLPTFFHYLISPRRDAVRRKRETFRREAESSAGEKGI